MSQAEGLLQENHLNTLQGTHIACIACIPLYFPVIAQVISYVTESP